jgi:hypothetical protein
MVRVIIMAFLVTLILNFLLAPAVSSYFSLNNKIIRRLTLIPPMGIIGVLFILVYEIAIKSIKEVWND